ncbi:hypothetical protein CIB84_005038, partial [Bambusicola thoracicus]
SIVSTLLALMDGLDNRGEIVVIGATNRLDSIDPALRRPGRFDREFLFNLPDQKARKHILQIHTRDWNPKLSDPFLGELAEKCVGYCGADIKALCTEAALIALRRRYPQIYVSSQKLQLDVSSVVLSAQDFYHAMQNIVPASQRAVTSSGHALSPVIRPLLERTFADLLEVLHKVFPHAEFSQNDKSEDVPSLILDDSEDENASSIFETSCPSGSPKKQSSAAIHKPYLHFTTVFVPRKSVFRGGLEELQLLVTENGELWDQGFIDGCAALRAMEVLPLALPSPARELSEAEKQRMEDQEENTLRELRLFLRDVTKRLATDKRFNIFSKPVDIEEVSDYLEVIKEPMDLSTVITKIDKHNYLTAKDFLTDIDLICSNALEYNPDKDPGGLLNV